MSFGFSPGDIIAVVRIAWTVYEKCFTQANAADQKYYQFGEEIKGFAESLEQLDRVFKNVANQRRERPYLRGNAARRESLLHQLPSSLTPLPALTGDFGKTIRACEKLLHDNSKFRWNSAGFIDNVRWWMGVEDDISALRERIRFHTTKILLISKPVELQLLLDIRKEIWDIKGTVERIEGILLNWDAVQERLRRDRSREGLPEVPNELERRFRVATENNPPFPIDMRAFPLAEGFNSFVYHFELSTYGFVPRGPMKTPELTQYLNLVKCNWILQQMKKSSVFIQGSLWERCFEDIETDVLNEYRKFDTGELHTPSEDVILRLQEHCFSIWTEEETVDVSPHLTKERPGEEKVLEIRLPRSQSNRTPMLLVFRKSDHELRIVHVTIDEQNEFFFEAESKEFSMHHTRFIPLYAVPNPLSSASTNNVLLVNSQGQSPQSYSFDCAKDVEGFQRAVTGYQVGTTLTNVTWKTFRETYSGTGTIQIWHAKPLARMASAESSTSQSPTSPNLNRQSTTVSSLTLAQSLATTANGSVVQGLHGLGVTYTRPQSPLIILYTLHEDCLAFTTFELRHGLFINPRGCHCSDCRAKLPCRHVLLETSNRPLKLKRYVTRTPTSGVDTWDLALLRHPPHPSLTLQENGRGAARAAPRLPLVVAEFGVKHVMLGFGTVEAKEDFRKTFQGVERLREREEREYRDAIHGNIRGGGR